VVRKWFSFNEFGPSLLDWANAFLRDSPSLYGQAVPRQRCSPARAIPNGLQGLPPVSKAHELLSMPPTTVASWFLRGSPPTASTRQAPVGSWLRFAFSGTRWINMA
jgi:hypothetical protein